MRRLTLPAILIASCCLPVSARAAEGLKYVEPNDATGSSAAVVVPDTLLVHTTQMLPVDAEGRVAAGDVAAQVKRVFENLETALKEAKATSADIIKLNFVVAKTEVVAAVRVDLAKRFAGKAKPAVSYAVSPLPKADALVAADAVAVCGRDAEGRVQRWRARGLPGHVDASHVAVLPLAPRVYISGQAEKGELLEATRKTLESLEKTLAFLELKTSDVAQVKAFLKPMSAAGEVEKEVARFFKDQTMPPLVFVEWESTLPIEIEMVVAGKRDAKTPEAEVVTYLTPPGMTASPIYSRVARINHGKTIYVSGLYASKATTAEAEVEEIFATLKRVLEKVGGDFKHLAKATYYVSTDDASKKLNELRPKFYDPKRPPAASKAFVKGTGVEGKGLTLDMIAAQSSPAAEGKAQFGHGLTPDLAAAGWISLFDGKTTFGWERATVENGTLKAATSRLAFASYELRAEFVFRGRIMAGGKQHDSDGLHPLELKVEGPPAPISIVGFTGVRSLIIRPLGTKPLFNGKDLAGWQRIDRPQLPEERRPQWSVVDGRLIGVGGPGALEYQDAKFADLVLQVEARTRDRHVNGGVFFRTMPGSFMNGYEAQIYNRGEDNDPARPFRYSTGSIDDRQLARHLVSRDGNTFTLTVIAQGSHFATWVNGHQLADWTDTRAKHENPRQGLRLEAGTIQLQAHDPETDLEFFSIRAGGVK